MYDVVLFDMDGVILEDRGTHPDVYRRAARDALAEFGVTAPPEDAAATLGATRYDDSMADACAELGIDRDEFWAARERYASRRTNERIRTGDRGIFDDVDAVSSLAETARIGLVSNNRQATVDFAAKRVVTAPVDVAIGRAPTLADYRRRKPEPDFIEAALAALGVDDALYVGDRSTDVIAAERAGIDTAFLRRPHNGCETLDREPSLVLDSLRELPRIDRSYSDGS